MDFDLCLEKGRGAEMNIDSKRFALLKSVTAYLFELWWAHPLIYILVCSCGLIGLMFPKVLQCLVSFILICISTYLFLAAFVSAQPPLPQSLRTEVVAEQKSAENHEGEKHGDRHTEKFYEVSWQGETQIADWHENVETVREAKPVQKFEGITNISNGGRNLLKSKCEEDLDSFEANGVHQAPETSSGNPSDVIVLEDEDEKELASVEESKLPFGLRTVEEEEEEEEVAQEEDNGRKHGFVSSEGEEEDDGRKHGFLFSEGEEEGGEGNDIRLENFFFGWKSQFESSSDSLSEASSLADLGHLLDELDPLLLTDEEEDEADDPNASTKAQEDEDDRPAIWAAEDEGLFDLGHHHTGSDSESMSSEGDNLIEIEISKNQVLDDDQKEKHDQRNYLGDSQAEEPNLIDLDYPEEGQNLTNLLWEEAGAYANYPEEENLIEIDLSADTIVVPPADEDKVSSIHFFAEKKIPTVDFSIDGLYGGWVSKVSLPCVPSATVVELIDLNSPSILEMNMAGSEDEQSKPEKTESIHFSITKKIQEHYIANLLD